MPSTLLLVLLGYAQPDDMEVAIRTLVPLLIVGVLVFAADRRGRGDGAGKSPTLVLSGFELDAAATLGACVQITGRPTGLVAWLLTTMGLSTTTRLTVTDADVSVHVASLSGEFNTVVPLRHVASTHCGHTKPFALLAVGVAVGLVGVLAGLNVPSGGAALVLLGLAVAAALIAYYFLSKKIAIRVVTDGGTSVQLVFKPSLLNGVPVDVRKTNDALALIGQRARAMAVA